MKQQSKTPAKPGAEQPETPPPEPAQIILEGGWGPGGTDIPGPPEPSADQSSRIGAFPDAPDDESPDPKE